MTLRRVSFVTFRGILATFLASVLFLASAPIAAADGGMPGSCRSVRLSVALGSDQPESQTVSGTLCNPRTWSGHDHEVDVLVHGATYNGSYWNWPVNTGQYSYVNQTLRAGRATFAYDAIGAGASSHPLSTAITIDSQAYALHHVLQWLRDQHSYTKYTVVGHSLGSITAVAEAAAYRDENDLILTGYSHAFNAVDEAGAFGDLYPASLDPEFAGASLDTGYLTTTPGSRSTLFYDTDTANPAIIAYDEAHKDIVSSTYFGGALAETSVPPAGNIAASVVVPVVEVLGQEDFLFCGTGAPADCTQPATIKAYDQPYFANAPSLSVITIPNTGHDLTLHPSNGYSFFKINQWINTH